MVEKIKVFCLCACQNELFAVNIYSIVYNLYNCVLACIKFYSVLYSTVAVGKKGKLLKVQVGIQLSISLNPFV